MQRGWLGAGIAVWCAAHAAGQTALSPDEALAALQGGNRQFAAGASVAPPLGEGVRRTLRSGEHPFAIVVACADSRVPPEHVFNAGLGELFVVRLAGPVCDPEALASIEYAAETLGAPLCVVLAHDGCAAVRAAAEGPPVSPAMGRLLERIDPALQRARREGWTGADLLARSEVENAYETIAQCVRRSPVLRELIRLRRLRIVPAQYKLETGEVTWLPERAIEPTRERDVPLPEIDGLPPHVVLSMLHAGHRRFLTGARPTAELTPERRERLTHGQRPIAVVLACSDSRVAPEHLFDAGLGELFVVRVAGNVLNDATLASLEHAVAQTGASVVVVMGHQRCTAVRAAAEQLEDPHLSASMRELLQRIEPSVALAAREEVSADAVVERAIEINVLRVVAQLRARSALLRRLEEDGALGLVPVVYELDSGDLRWLKDTPLTALLARDPAPAPVTEAAPPAPLAEIRPTPPPAPSADRPPVSAPPAAADDAELRREQLKTLLVAFMVACSGVGFLLLLQHRVATQRAAAAVASDGEDGEILYDDVGEVEVE